jgi:hypothetical protein
MRCSFSRQYAAASAALSLLVAVGLTVGTQSAALAQAAPAGTVASPGPSTAPAASGAGNPSTKNPSGGSPNVPAAPATHAQSIGHLPIFDFVTTFTQPAYYSSSSQIHAYDPVDVGGTIRLPISRQFSLYFDRLTEGTLNQPLQAQGATKPGDTRDIVLQYHGTYTFNRSLALDVGESFRHRIYANDTSGVSNVPFPYTVSSTEHHFAYAGLFYTTRPIAGLLHSTFVFGETLDAQNVDHHVGVLCTAAFVAHDANDCLAVGTVGYLDENPNKNRYYETTQSVTWLLPIDAKHGTTFSLNERWGALNFYENAPFPYRFDSALTYLLNKRFSPGFTLGLRHQDFHEATLGAPFPSPNVIHVGSYDVIGTFHLDTNTLFH